MRSRVAAVASFSRTGRSMTSLMRSSYFVWRMIFFEKPVSTFSDHALIELQPREGFQRIVGAHARPDGLRQRRRGGIVAAELPMRVIGREQEHLVGADLVDDVGDAGRVGRSVE